MTDTKLREAAIGLYDESLNIIGYKADSFWSLTKNLEHAKLHWVPDGIIPAHLIKNLGSILSSTANAHPITAILANVNRERFYGDFETMLVGYSFPGEATVFTHRVFPEAIEELTAEDKARIQERQATNENLSRV